MIDKEKNLSLIEHIQAIQYENIEQIEAVLSVIKKLRKNCAALKDTDSRFNTPLILAANRNLESVCVALVKKGADINAHNVFGLTPVIWACEVGNKKLAQFFVEHGANINSRLPKYESQNTEATINDLSNCAGPLACCLSAAAGTARQDKHALYKETVDYLLSLCVDKRQANIFKCDIESIHPHKKDNAVYRHAQSKLNVLLEKFDLEAQVSVAFDIKTPNKNNKI